MTTTSFKKAYKFDASGYFEHVLAVQVVDGDALMPPSCTLVAPVSTGGMDASKFYRFDGKTWIAESKPTCAADLIGVVISHESQTPHDVEMRSLIQSFARVDGFREKRGDDLSWSLEKIPEKTEAEKREEAEKSVRSKRDALLSESDYYLQPDYPATEAGLTAVKAYRTDLRNVPQQAGFPYDVVWPETPNVLK